MGQLTIAGNAKSRGISNVDARLLSIIAAAAAKSPYNVQVFSGVRYGSSTGSRHNTGKAVDIVLSTPNGQKIPNNKSSVGFPIYQDFAKLARQEQQALHPELSDQFRWGGYFAGGKGKYGAIDLMHFDLKKNAPMAGGSWEEGLTPEQAKVVAKMGPGEVYSADGIWNYNGQRMLPSLFGRGGLVDGALEGTGLAGREVPPPGASVLTPQQIAANYAAYRPAPNTAAPPGIGSDPDRNMGLSPSQIADNYAQYRPSLTTQPLTAPITPVQSAPLGPTPGALAAQYAQYRPTPNLAPPSVGGVGSDPDRNLSRSPSSQAIASMSSQEIASRVAAAQAQNTGSLTPAMVARYASGMTPAPAAQGGIGSDPDRNASFSLSPRQIAENQNAYRPSLTTQPPSAPVTPVSRAPLGPTPGTMQQQYAQYRPAPNIAPAQPQPAPAAPATQYQTVKVVTYPAAAPSKPLGQGGIGSDPDRNMATPMTMAEQYAAYRPTPNTLPPEAKKPEPVITYKKVPIPTVNDARKNGAVAAPLVPQQQAMPGVPAPLMANGPDRTPKYFQPRYGLGWAGGFIGGLAGGPLGKMVGKQVGKYIASKLTRTDLPMPENFAGYGLGAIQNVQNGVAGPSSYAQARNNAAGYTTQWSNTGPGGSPVQTTSTPGGTTYSTYSQYGPSPMTLVTYGTSGTSTQPRSSSGSTGNGGYTTSTGNLY